MERGRRKKRDEEAMKGTLIGNTEVLWLQLIRAPRRFQRT